MTCGWRRTSAEREQGSILMLAMLTTVLLLGQGLAVMWVAASDTRVAANITRRQEGLFAAEAGLDRGRAFLATQAGWTPSLDPGTSCGATRNDPGYPAAPGKGKVLCAGGAALEDVQLKAGTTGIDGVSGSGNLRYTVWVRNDPAEIQSNIEKSVSSWTDQDYRVVVRSEGIARDALSGFAIEAVVSRAALSSVVEGWREVM
jgi:Tfp pilus assembly protein PilX